jgi:DNA-binding HxlR family transcriptional regulator
MRVKNKEVVVKLNGQTFHCAMDITMNFIGGKWKTVVLWYLRKDKKRFTELHKLIPQITERMLSITLKQLEADKLIVRDVFNKKPPLKVEYSLSEFGETLIPVLNSIAKWGRELSEQKGEIIELKD